MLKPSLRHWGASLTLLLSGLPPSLACSSSSDEQRPITSTPENYCQTVCQKAHSCNDATDAGACRSACATELAAMPQLRGDFLAYVGTCIAASLCSPASAGRCKDEAQAQLAPSKYGQSLCAAYQSAGAQCDSGDSSTPSDVCFEAAKSYDDSALQAANGCIAQACTDQSPCFAQALPEVRLPH